MGAERGLVLCPELRNWEGLGESGVNEALDGYQDESGGKGVAVHPMRR